MDALAAALGLDPSTLMFALTIAGIFTVGLIVLRIIRKITATLLRLGCLGLIIIVGGLILLNRIG